METKPIEINPSLVFEDYLFTTHRDRCLYIGTSIRDRPKWLKDNPDAWRRIEDVHKELASLQRRVAIPVEAIAAGPSSHMSSPDVRSDGNNNAGSVDVAAADPPPTQQPTLAKMLPVNIAAPSASGVEDEIAIGSRRYVSAQRLASMQGISPRTLTRRRDAGKLPPEIKIGNKLYFEVRNVPEG